MSTADSLAALKTAFSTFRTTAAADAAALAAKEAEAQAVLDSITGDKSQHAAMVALADVVSLALKGESVVQSTAPATWHKWALGVLGVGVAGVAFGIVKVMGWL